MKLKSMLVASAAVSALAAAAPAQSGTYISLFGGIGSLEPGSVNMDQGPFIETKFTDVGSVSVNTVSGFVSQDVRFLPGNHLPGRITSPAGNTSYYTNMYVTNITRHLFVSTVHNSVTHEFSEDNLDVGYVVGAALGMEFGLGLRAELELTHRSNGIGGIRHLNGGRNLYIYEHHTNYYQGSAKYYSQTTTKTTKNSITYVNDNLHTNSSNATATFTRSFSLVSRQSTADALVQTNGDITAYAVMANLWWDFPVRESNVQPFIGGGVGLANLDVGYDGKISFSSRTISATNRTIAFSSDTSDWVPAWQVGGGLAFGLGEGMTLTAQYRYFGTGEVVLPNGSSVAIESHMVLLGLSFPLGRQ